MKKTLAIVGVILLILTAAFIYWYVSNKKKEAALKSNALAIMDDDIKNGTPKIEQSTIAVKKTDMKPLIAISKQVRGLGIKI